MILALLPPVHLPPLKGSNSLSKRNLSLYLEKTTLLFSNDSNIENGSHQNVNVVTVGYLNMARARRKRAEALP